MEKGIVQQVGSPTEIYDNPANTFVASFIGNPAMNLVDGEISGGVFKAPNLEIKGFKNHSGPVTLGYRAEDASIAKKSAELNAKVYSMELLGDATMVTVKCGPAIVSVKADKDFRAEIGEAVSANIPAGICHLFDAKTGARLT
jgi:multiple sugar transport system ATP-binding protein